MQGCLVLFHMTMDDIRATKVSLPSNIHKLHQFLIINGNRVEISEESYFRL